MSLPSFQAAEATWKFHVTVAHLTDNAKHTACGRVLETVDSPTKEWDGKSHKCTTCEKYEQKELAKKQPKEPWINPDTFSRQYEREAEREWK